MRRREMQAVLVAAAVAATLLVGPVGQARSEAQVKACTDIIEGGPGRAADGAVTFRLRTAASSCRGITYTVSIFDGDPNNPEGRAPLATVAQRGDGSAADQGFYNLYFTFPLVTEPADGILCFTGSSAGGGSRVFDVAPDAGEAFCVDPDSSGGSVRFR